ncbi:putative MFS transporter [Pyrenochaeta sp. MPI-SDFR-AT-0127]|nr:putative MFS transporter [Pyrenochaeta sp. MPI-SDFR-AT-0127]
MSADDHARTDAVREAAARHHGLPLVPQPTQDEKDPLRWPRTLKLAALAATAFVNFTANFAGAGLSYNFLLLGIGNLIWVPLGVKYGKRASLLISTLILFAILIWTAKETTFNGLLAARCLSGFASAAGESIVPSIVSDIFFLHERAAMMSAYTILASSATAIGPLLASFIIEYSRGGWVDYAWVCAALAGANTVAIYLLYPESNFNRVEVPMHEISTLEIQLRDNDAAKGITLRTETMSEHQVSVVEKPWTSIWTAFVTVDEHAKILEVFIRPLMMLFKPSVFLAVYIYGTSLAAQIILIFAFPSLLMAPPYLFSGSSIGLMQIAAIIGFVIGSYAGGYAADTITAAVIRRHRGAVYAEQRLIALIPGCLIAPVGCILIAFACSEKLQWVAIAIGFGFVSFGTIYGPNIAITYVVECYPRHAAECLVAINVFKNFVAFLFLYVAVDWVSSRGWIEVYMIMFMLVSLGMLSAIPFYFFGRKWRNETETTFVNV